MDIGHNQPPSQIDFTGQTAKVLSDWMRDNPVVQDEEQARAGKLLVDRAAACLKDLENERSTKVGPLNDQVREINNEYRGPKTILEKVLGELKLRIFDYIRVEEQRKRQEAEEKTRLLVAAEQRAREAERKEQEAKADASVGVADIDIGEATATADAAFQNYKKAAREAARAEKETHVRIGGGFARALSSRTTETLVVTNPLMAVNTLGWTVDLLDCIIKMARAYRKLHGRLPPGIESRKEKEL